MLIACNVYHTYTEPADKAIVPCTYELFEFVLPHFLAFSLLFNYAVLMAYGNNYNYG